MNDRKFPLTTILNIRWNTHISGRSRTISGIVFVVVCLSGVPNTISPLIQFARPVHVYTRKYRAPPIPASISSKSPHPYRQKPIPHFGERERERQGETDRERQRERGGKGRERESERGGRERETEGERRER